MNNCDHCGDTLTPNAAATSRRALSGRVLCWLCRVRLTPRFTSPHQSPKGCTETLRPTGYGLYVCDLTTPAGSFQGSGLTEEQAISRARSAARTVGALA